MLRLCRLDGDMQSSNTLAGLGMASLGALPLPTSIGVTKQPRGYCGDCEIHMMFLVGNRFSKCGLNRPATIFAKRRRIVLSKQMPR